jgi:hypothetical protein
LLRRLERSAVIGGVVMMLAAFAVTRGSVDAAASVAGGWLLIATTYLVIRSSVDSLAGDAREGKTRGFAWTIVKLAGRYALLAFLAYVMIARLRLHPLGLMAGASLAVAAASVEAVRFLVKKS